MAREARKISNSGNYYIILRGDELFVSDEDKRVFKEILEKNFATGILHSLYITKNEIRIVAKVGERSISMTMKSITTSYARYFNRVNNRNGKLFDGRFKSEPLESDDEIKNCIRNIQTDKGTVKKKSTKKKTGTVKKEKTIEETKQTEEVEVKREVKPKQSSLPSWLL